MRATVTLPMATLALLLLAAAASHAQWELEDSGTKASLRGVYSVGGGVAWASGTDGTVIRTEDGGYLWQGCALPPGAEHLDFRGVQAFDENTAIVMSSGPGDQSRLYRTTDGCRTWKLLFTNPDKDGFWDALVMNDRQNGWIAGDPVSGKFVMESTGDGASTFPGFKRSASAINLSGSEGLPSNGRGAFAASNSALAIRPSGASKKTCKYSLAWFGTSGPGGALVIRLERDAPGCSDVGTEVWRSARTPIAGANATSGIFSLAFRDDLTGVAVGGDYRLPETAALTAARSVDGGETWRLPQTPPHGYRSSVAYDPTTKTWITVGPNGSDYSTDDGRNWHPLGPTPQDAPGSDREWNALSLPFVVGPHGRVGKLRGNALPAADPPRP